MHATHETLWNENRDLADACLEHPFVQGLRDGTLEREAFKRYVAQDAFFLRSFLRAYAAAAAKCESVEHARVFHTLMGGVFEELKLHADFSNHLGIDLDGVVPFPETLAYTDFLTRAAWHEPPGFIAAAMVPCMRLYHHLGGELKRSGAENNPYQDWIDTYSGSEFAELTRTIEALLDELTDDSPETRDAYRYAMQCELDFFGAPLNPR